MARPGLIRTFFEHVVPGVLKPLRTLWNEIVGFFFIVLALFAVRQGWLAVRNFDGDGQSFFEVVLIGIWMAVMLGFGLSSFRRARRISRS